MNKMIMATLDQACDKVNNLNSLAAVISEVQSELMKTVKQIPNNPLMRDKAIEYCEQIIRISRMGEDIAINAKSSELIYSSFEHGIENYHVYSEDEKKFIKYQELSKELISDLK